MKSNGQMNVLLLGRGGEGAGEGRYVWELSIQPHRPTYFQTLDQNKINVHANKTNINDIKWTPRGNQLK